MSGTNKRKMTSRELSLEVIYNVLENGKYLKESVEDAVSAGHITDPRDRAFITALSEGTVERCIELDHITDKYSSKRTDKLKPYIRNILRMTVYQIKYMDRVPDNASVDEAVRLAVKKGYGGLKGFVNGVLRNIARTYQSVEYPDRESEPVKYFSVLYSMPEWIVEHFINELGTGGLGTDGFGINGPEEDELSCILEYFLAGRELTIRTAKCCPKAAYELINTLNRTGYKACKGRIFDYAVRMERSGSVGDIPGYDEGDFVVQDESSMIPAHVAAEYVRSEYFGSEETAHTGIMSDRNMSSENMRVEDGAVSPVKLKILDMCAAPGGKALHAAALFGDMAEVEARDVSDAKVSMITDNIERLGIEHVHVRKADALIRNEADGEMYDIIIADLPCSGLGVMAKKPDIKYNVKKEDLSALAALQSDMLDNAAFYVKRGGIIVYSTCTVSRSENEDNCSAFLERHPGFDRVNPENFVPERIRDSVTECGNIKILPGKYGSDGFFVAVFRRR